MTLRPDLVNCWVFRGGPAGTGGKDSAGGRRGADGTLGADGRELLLLRRAPDEPILPGLWQGVAGGLELGETIVAGALRELHEETGFDGAVIEAFYDLDLVTLFHEPSMDTVLASADFAVRVRTGVEPALSAEHDAARWVSLAVAEADLVWPSYRTAVARIREDLAVPERAAWFELRLDGERPQR